MTGTQETHIGFSDESHWNTGRFRSIALVTMPLAKVPEVEKGIAAILARNGPSEFKWSDPSGHRWTTAAIGITDLAVALAVRGNFRVDTLIWDIRDSRHNILGRDDTENYERMFHHICRNVFRSRWPDDTTWMLRPDEHTSIRWPKVEAWLDHFAVEAISPSPNLFEDSVTTQIRHPYSLKGVVEANSSVARSLQLVDLFAGLAVFSHEKFTEYNRWLTSEKQKEQTVMFNPAGGAASSRSDTARFPVLHHLDTACKAHKMGVSLKSNRGLVTPDPQNPINFWAYTPQHVGDRAPTRSQQ